MKRLATWILILMCWSLCARAQSDSLFHFSRSFRGPVYDFTVDNLGNLYVIYQNGQLKKMSPRGDSVAVFNNVRNYGRVYSIDVSNPLKILLYYRDFSTVVVLDRFLNIRTTIDLRRSDLLQVSAIAQSYDNKIWVYDQIDNRLKKIGDDGRLIDQSADFRMVFDTAPSPQFITDQDRFVYLYDPLKGVYIFDYFGGFKNKMAFTGWSDFRVINNTVLGRDSSRLYRYDMGTLQLQQFDIPENMRNAKRLVITPGNVYVLRNESIEVYSYSQSRT